MRVCEVVAALPFDAAAYQRGSVYTSAAMSVDYNAENGGEVKPNISIITCHPYDHQTGGPLDSGIFTLKHMDITKSLPGWITVFLSDKDKIIEERCWQAPTLSRTSYSYHLIKSFQLTVTTAIGEKPAPLTPHLDEEEKNASRRKVIIPTGVRHPVSIMRKIIAVDVTLWPFSSKVCDFVVETTIKWITDFTLEMIRNQDKWLPMTLEETVKFTEDMLGGENLPENKIEPLQAIVIDPAAGIISEAEISESPGVYIEWDDVSSE